MRIGRMINCLLVALLLPLALPAFGQATEQPEDMAASGYFRDQDTLPGAYRIYSQLPGGKGGLWGARPQQ